MERLLRTDDYIAQMAKPGLEVAQSIALGVGDVLIVCAGFEDRAVEVLSRASKIGSVGFDVIAVEYHPHIVDNKRAIIEDLCAKCRSRISWCVYDRKNPAGGGMQIVSAIGRCARVFVDISGMSRLLIVQLLVELFAKIDDARDVCIFYVEAAQYPPTKSDVEKVFAHMQEDQNYAFLFLSSGVFEVCVVPELSSVSLPGQPLRLIAFPSFNPDQLTALRTEIQSAEITLIQGNPPAQEHQWRTEAIKRLNFTDNIARCDQREASTLDYRGTADILIQVYRKFGQMERLVIAPTGSKMQTVAVALIRAFLDDIQIVYPTPRTFKTQEYTVGATNIYCLPMRPFFDLYGTLRKEHLVQQLW